MRAPVKPRATRSLDKALCAHGSAAAKSEAALRKTPLAGPGAKYAFKKEMKLYDAFIPILIYTSRNLISLEYLICYFLFNSEHTRYLQKKTVQARHDAYQLQLYERLVEWAAAVAAALVAVLVGAVAEKANARANATGGNDGVGAR